MSVPDRRDLYASRYAELLDDFTAALGGPNIPPVKRAMAKTLAVMNCQLLTLGDRFANSQGGSADDMAQFLKVSTAVTDLFASLGLSHAMQQTPIANPRETDDLRAALKAAFERVMEQRRQDAARASTVTASTEPPPREPAVAPAPKPAHRRL
jgi:hypothetical protein